MISQLLLRIRIETRIDVKPSRYTLRCLVFLVESGVTTEMTYRYGHGQCGERVCESAPGGHWHTVTLLGTITIDDLLATMTIPEPTDGDRSLAYLEQVLCPRLRPSQVVVMDNLSAHKHW